MGGHGLTEDGRPLIESHSPETPKIVSGRPGAGPAQAAARDAPTPVARQGEPLELQSIGGTPTYCLDECEPILERLAARPASLPAAMGAPVVLGPMAAVSPLAPRHSSVRHRGTQLCGIWTALSTRKLMCRAPMSYCWGPSAQTTIGSSKTQDVFLVRY